MSGAAAAADDKSTPQRQSKSFVLVCWYPSSAQGSVLCEVAEG
jgi:hypothetical protein